MFAFVLLLCMSSLLSAALAAHHVAPFDPEVIRFAIGLIATVVVGFALVGTINSSPASWRHRLPLPAINGNTSHLPSMQIRSSCLMRGLSPKALTPQWKHPVRLAFLTDVGSAELRQKLRVTLALMAKQSSDSPSESDIGHLRTCLQILSDSAYVKGMFFIST